MRAELSPFTETSTVEMSGWYTDCFLFLSQTRVHQPLLIFPKVLITEITNTVKRCSWLCPGIFPEHNHLLCTRIPATIKLLLLCKACQFCCSKCHQRGDQMWLAWAPSCVTFRCAVVLTSVTFPAAGIDSERPTLRETVGYLRINTDSNKTFWKTLRGGGVIDSRFKGAGTQLCWFVLT